MTGGSRSRFCREYADPGILANPKTSVAKSMASGFESPIFVTGVPRSGTSLVAGALGIAGAWLGRTVPGNQSNPKGYFEHTTIREKVIKPLLEGLQCDPLGVHRLPALAQLPQVDNLKEVCRNLIGAEGYSDDARWLYKDAKLSLLWPLFVDAFSGAHWVIVRRGRDDIVRSCLRADFMAQHSSNKSLCQNGWINTTCAWSCCCARGITAVKSGLNIWCRVISRPSNNWLRDLTWTGTNNVPGNSYCRGHGMSN